jgi:mycofactocin system glycosyltransferase
MRLLRLSARGAAQAARWRDGAPVGDAAGNRDLAARMLAVGILMPEPPADLSRLANRVTVAVPVKDRPDELARCLTALAGDAPAVAILVVDDGSADPHAIASVAALHGARIIRLDQSAGPAGARNAALESVGTPLIAFVDSDVVVDRGWLARLVSKFDDPGVGAAAPRVRALHDRGGLLTEYEARHSSLDMGPHAGLVGVGRAVPYVPSAALIVRLAVAPERFDETLVIGEDVDFVWRIAERGGRVLYDPTATVRHDHRVAFRTFVRRRFLYARSIGPLARRHPQAVPAMQVEPWSTLALLLLAAGRLEAGIGAAATIAMRTTRIRAQLTKSTDQPTQLALRLVCRALVGSARGLGHATRRTWSPILLPVACRSRNVRVVLAAAVIGAAADEHVRPRHLPVKVLDDLLAAIGTWAGCWDERTLRPVLPSRLRRQMASPPSTGTAAPVMPLASGPANHAIANAISSAESRRSSG